MHQKNSQEGSGFGSYNGFDEEDDDDDDDGHEARDPFADVDDDDLDDDLDEDEPQTDSRGGWWRGVVSRAPGGGEQHDSDDEEFGDFAMAEEEKAGVSATPEGSPEKVLLKPLAVNPMKEAARGLSGLWPFGSRAETTTTEKSKTAEDEGEVMVSPAGDGEQEKDKGGPVEAKEGIRRTSIEEVDDDEVVNVDGAASK